MASTIKVTVSGTRSWCGHKLTERFACADRNPSAEVLKDCLHQVEEKFTKLHGTGSVESKIDIS